MVVCKYMEQLAKKHFGVKFVKIVANKCLEKMTDDKCPAVILYQNGKLIKQFIPLKHYVGGFSAKGSLTDL